MPTTAFGLSYRTWSARFPFFCEMGTALGMFRDKQTNYCVSACEEFPWIRRKNSSHETHSLHVLFILVLLPHDCFQWFSSILERYFAITGCRPSVSMINWKMKNSICLICNCGKVSDLWQAGSTRWYSLAIWSCYLNFQTHDSSTVKWSL